MAHYGTLRDYRFADLDTDEDIRGAHVYGRDDNKLGRIDDVIFDHTTGDIRYVVIDTGGWLSSRKFIVAAERLSGSAKHEDDFQINATKRQIEAFPPYKEDEVREEGRWKDYEKRYKAAWHDGPVQHRKGSDRDITPTPNEMPEEPGSMGSQLSSEEQRELSSRIIPAADDEVTIDSSGSGIGARWLTFEDRLRQHRRDITQSCTTCSLGPATDHSAQSAARERKAV